MSEHPTALPPEVADEQLVAYLDGELGAEEVEVVEQRLSSDADYRRRLLLLQRAWDLLDDLPRAMASESFTQSTVSVVALKAVESRSFWQRHRTSLLAAIGTLSIGLAALLGFAMIYAWYDAPNQRLIRNLPIIENLDAYQTAGSVEFLRDLQRKELFQEEWDDVP